MKINENLTLIQRYHDEEKTKLQFQYHVDQFGRMQSEEKWWYENGQIFLICNRKDGIYHGKYQRWHEDATRDLIDSRHFKKGVHGTKIYFKYENK